MGENRDKFDDYIAHLSMVRRHANFVSFFVAVKALYQTQQEDATTGSGRPTSQSSTDLDYIRKGHSRRKVEAYCLQHQSFYGKYPLAVELNSLHAHALSARDLYSCEFHWSTDLRVHVYLSNN